MKANDEIAPVGGAAVEQMVAGVASVGGAEGLMDLAVDLAIRLAELIEQVAAQEGRTASDVVDGLFLG